LVAVKNLIAKIAQRDKISSDEAEKIVTDAVFTALNAVKPKFVGYLNEVRIGDKPSEKKRSILVMARVAGIREAFVRINGALQINEPTQPAHLSIYTAENRLPLDMTSPKELDDWSHQLSEASRDELTQQLDPYKTFQWSRYMSPAPVKNNLILEFHVPSFAPEREFYEKFGFKQINYDPISGGGTSDLGYFEIKREDSLGRTQLNFYGDKDSVAKHARFNEFPPDTPRGYAVEVTIPVDDVEDLWERVGTQLPEKQISQPLEIKRWGKRDFRVVDPFGFYIRFTEP
jgi:uncharacterized glyoxalase superfamily protein PhnB